MIPTKQISYFRIGTFVITGIILLVIAILILGSGMLFKKVIYVETYFDESVQGLIEGSPVKYLGMEIGNVVDINSVENVYKFRKNSDTITSRYIYVKMALSPKFFAYLPMSEIQKRIEKDVATGLRFKLAPQGLTGNVYVELDFFDPKTHPPLPIHWQPENFYIPSTISVLTYFTDNVMYLLQELRKVDFKEFFNNMLGLINSTNKMVFKTDRLLAQTNRQVVDTVDNLQNISQNLNALSEQAKAFPSHLLFGRPPPPLDLGKL